LRFEKDGGRGDEPYERIGEHLKGRSGVWTIQQRSAVCRREERLREGESRSRVQRYLGIRVPVCGGVV